MTAIWPGSRIPYIDENGDPMVGAKLRFYNSGTTTPQVVYSDPALANPLDQPILANARGMFPAVYLSATPGIYRQRLTEADDTLVFDDDEISVPQAADYVPPDTGDTSETLLARTGDLKFRYGTGAHSGWVRAAGRTIGSATSGAAERANDDCQELFEHLWTVDATLTVSSGRGASAAGDWAANKTIALPDMRDRTPVGLGDMGNSDANLIADTLVDGSESNTTLGATLGVSTVTLTEDQIPAHDHTATFEGQALAAHAHGIQTADDTSGPGGFAISNNSNNVTTTINSAAVSAGTPAGSVTVANAGGGLAHGNVQPGMFASWYIKL